MIVRTSKGSGITGAVRYVMGEGKVDPETGKRPELAPGEKSRVAWYGGTGFGFPIDSDERLDIARRVMEWAAVTQASKTKKCKEDCFHLMLAWDRDEQPARAEMEAAAHSVLKHLGMEQARAIWAAHDDTEHMHLHIVASRIDPQTGKAFSDSFDKTRLSEWALQWEKDHGGVKCEARLDKEQQQAERDPEKIINAFAARRETFTAFDLNRELTQAIPSRDTRRQYIGLVLERPDIIQLADPESGRVVRYTTRQTLAAEHLAEASGDRLHGDASHQVSGRSFHTMLDALDADGKELRTDQMAAVVHATGPEGLAIIAGKAGTGKTFTMSAIAAAYEADGSSVTSLAPTNKVASALKRDGLDAATIHSALGNLDRGRTEWNDKTVIMVDEAGMISTRLMSRLLSHAEYAGAKVILLGDEKQLASLDRGGMFGFFADQHGFAELSEITRQQGADQRELATRASHYDFKGALATLDREGGLAIVETSDERIAKAAEIWSERTAAAPERSRFVVAVSNKDAEAANAAIRQIRKERGDLGPNHIVATKDGEKPFAVGDRVLFSGSAFTREGRDAGLTNGNSGTVTHIEGARLSVSIDSVRNSEAVSFTVGSNREAGEFDAIRHGYAGTIFKAQGATYDEAIVIDSPSMRASTAYVALTRHREHVTVVTARDMQPPPVMQSWTSSQGGWEALTAEQKAYAEKSYAAWRAERNPKAGERYGLADYVAYVQGREAERSGRANAAPGHDITDIAKRWSRVDDRRAASRFEALNYTPPNMRDLTPAEVRAAVGVEAFEQGEMQASPIAASAVIILFAEAAGHRQQEGTGDRTSGRETDESNNTADPHNVDPWRWHKPPRPRTVEEERRLLASFALPLTAHIQEQSTTERETGGGMKWWERIAVETTELWHEARDWVRGKWAELVARDTEPNKDSGPDLEK